MTEKQLLPVGFYDLLFDEAEKNHKNVNKAVDAFLASGYRLVKTPLVEFAESFSVHNSTNSFRLVDVISGRNLILRNDITPQISRILASRLKDEKLPLKLCYVGDVLCARNNDLYVDRQQTQVGVEIIGCDDEKSNFEIIAILLSTLKDLQLKNLVVEFALPNFLQSFLEEIGQKNNELLIDAIRQKNISQIRQLAGDKAEIISKITLSNQDLSVLAQDICDVVKSPNIAAEFARAQKISQFLQEKFAEVEVRFDLFGDEKTSYHRDIAFDVFCGDFSYPVARGGRYKINEFDAVGATIYMNFLRKIS